MADVAISGGTSLVRAPADLARWFYVGMAGLCALIAFGLFAPTYWLQVPAGTFTGSPLLHLHALLFSGWTLFFLAQTVMAASGRVQHHRAWGMLGIALATAMVLVGVAVAGEGLPARTAAGFGDGALSFMIVPVSNVVMFGVLVAVAVANVQRPAVHKRLMLLANVVLLQAAFARIFFAINVGIGPGVRPGAGPPLPVEASLMTAGLVDVLIGAALVFDWRTRGRPHRTYWIAGAAILAVQLLRVPISTTSWWHATAQLLAQF